jgi:hypothetical protein
MHQSTGSIIAMTAIDINGDKIPDLVLYGNIGNIVIRAGNGDGTFQADTVLAFDAISPVYIAVADFNRDGTPDLAGLSQSGITAFLNLPQPPPPLIVVSAASFASGGLAPGRAEADCACCAGALRRKCNECVVEEYAAGYIVRVAPGERRPSRRSSMFNTAS